MNLRFDFITEPQTIEKRSMEIIAPYLNGLNLDEKTAKVYSRIIHASGDVDYANIIRVHPSAVEAGLEALKKGCSVYTDVNMVKTGINKKRLSEFSTEAQVKCLVDNEKIAETAKKTGLTRSMAAMRAFGPELNGQIIAIGNAPTALFEVIRLMLEDNIRPALIIGVPVGFVGAKESKDLLCEVSPVPYITVLGNKGGSPIAAAAVNALLYITGK